MDRGDDHHAIELCFTMAARIDPQGRNGGRETRSVAASEPSPLPPFAHSLGGKIAESKILLEIEYYCTKLRA
jgi:hypothetical protein